MHEETVFITTLVLLCGCGGRISSADNIDGGAPIVVPGPVDELRAAFCRAARTCCAHAGAPSEPLVNCESNFDPMFPYTHSVAEGTMTFDAGKLGPCIARMDEQSRTCHSSRTICREAFSGTFAEGDACHHVAECKEWKDQPTVCLRAGVTDFSVKGVCRARALAKTGDWCSETCRRGNCSATLVTPERDYDLRRHPVCLEEDGLYCEPGSVCKAVTADGAPCTRVSCSLESYCDTVCKPRKAHGMTCTSDAECRDEHTCASGLCTAKPFATETICRGHNY